MGILANPAGNSEGFDKKKWKIQMAGGVTILEHCVVPENIHTPPRKVTGNSEGEGGSKAEISEGSGGFIGSSFSRG